MCTVQSIQGEREKERERGERESGEREIVDIWIWHGGYFESFYYVILVCFLWRDSRNTLEDLKGRIVNEEVK